MNMTHMLLCAGGAASLFACRPKAEAGITLVRDGRSDYTIVIGLRCSPSERHGAEELRMFLEQISGVRLPISEVDVPAPRILVGRSKALDRLGLDIDFEALGDEGFVIRTVDRDLVLAGGAQRGSMYACYEFLDRHLDCRWLTPRDSRIPRRETITLPDIDDRKVPALEYREPYYLEALDGDWAARNRMNSFNAGYRHAVDLDARRGGKMLYIENCWQHSYRRLVPSAKYFREHPEYFPLINGKRDTHYIDPRWPGVPRPAQLCLTNPELPGVIAATIREWLRDDPLKQGIISVSQEDGEGFCECGECRAMQEREGSLSGPVLQLANQVADAIGDEFPNVGIHTLAYGSTRKPPKHMRARPNVVVHLCSIECCFSHPLSSCDYEENRKFREDIATWSKICDRLWMWDYVRNFSQPPMPFPNLHVLQPNIKFFTDHGVKGVFAQGNIEGTGEMDELRAYLLARALWNPDCDWRREMDEFLAAFFGPAAARMRTYIDTLSTRVQHENIHVHGWAHPQRPGFLVDEILTKVDALFDTAEGAVTEDPLRLERVRTEHRSIDFVKATWP